MREISTFSPSDRMVDLIKDDYRLIQVLSRFGIPIGFGDKTVKEVCEENGVDCPTFLSLVNFLIGETEESIDNENLHIDSLVQFLSRSHTYFLKFCLPAIRHKLLDGISQKSSDVSFLIVKLFDEYVEEVKEHMEEEEKTLFPYVKSLIEKRGTGEEKPERFSDHHEQVGNKLKELKTIILRYCPPQKEVNILNAALYDIYRCEEELTWHCKVEDEILQPMMKRMQLSSRKKQTK